MWKRFFLAMLAAAAVFFVVGCSSIRPTRKVINNSYLMRKSAPNWIYKGFSEDKDNLYFTMQGKDKKLEGAKLLVETEFKGKLGDMVRTTIKNKLSGAISKEGEDVGAAIDKLVTAISQAKISYMVMEDYYEEVVENKEDNPKEVETVYYYYQRVRVNKDELRLAATRVMSEIKPKTDSDKRAKKLAQENMDKL